MKKVLCTLLLIVITFSGYSQMRRQQQRPNMQQEPSQSQIEERERKIAERKAEYISNFLVTLEADEFQKQIIKQTLDSYFEEKIALFKVPFERSFEREEAVRLLNENHFKELKTLISESDMTKINDMINGKFDDDDVKREKRKKRKKRSKN
ncbi:MAG: hypothetical protein HKM26_07335 [Winogradskyella sp.]|nr:hypothetical protein [Winogradskyella sp.]